MPESPNTNSSPPRSCLASSPGASQFEPRTAQDLRQCWLNQRRDLAFLLASVGVLTTRFLPSWPHEAPCRSALAPLWPAQPLLTRTFSTAPSAPHPCLPALSGSGTGPYDFITNFGRTPCTAVAAQGNLKRTGLPISQPTLETAALFPSTCPSSRPTPASSSGAQANVPPDCRQP